MLASVTVYCAVLLSGQIPDISDPFFSTSPTSQPDAAAQTAAVPQTLPSPPVASPVAQGQLPLQPAKPYRSPPASTATPPASLAMPPTSPTYSRTPSTNASLNAAPAESNNPTSGSNNSISASAHSKTSVEMLAAILPTPQNSPLSGESITLAQALSASFDRQQSSAITQAYWQATEALGRCRIASEAARRLDSIRPRTDDSASFRAMQLACAARKQEADTAALAAQTELAGLLAYPVERPLPLPADKPHLGAYRTYLQEMLGQNPPPGRLRMLDRLLPIRQAAVDRRAAAASAADDAVKAAVEAYQVQRGDLAALQAALKESISGQQAFLESVRRYNGEIAEYAFSVARPGATPQELAGMMITSGNAFASTAAGSSATATTSIMSTAPLQGGRPAVMQREGINKDGEVVPSQFLQTNPNGGFSTSRQQRPTPADPATRPADPSAIPRTASSRSSASSARSGAASPRPEAPRSSRPTDWTTSTSSSSTIPDVITPSDFTENVPATIPEQTEEKSKEDAKQDVNTAPLEQEKPQEKTTPPKEGKESKETGKTQERIDISSSHYDGRTALKPPSSSTLYTGLSGAEPAMQSKQLTLILHAEPMPSEMPGIPVVLRDYFERIGPWGGDRLAAVEAFWKNRECAALFAVHKNQAAMLEALSPVVENKSGHFENSSERLLFRAERLAVESAMLDCRADWLRSQFDLAQRMHLEADPIWPAAATPPHFGRYALNRQAIGEEAARATPIRRLMQTIPAGNAALYGWAEAVVQADVARSETVSRFLAGETLLCEALDRIAGQTDATRDFVCSLTEYNQALAEYALTVLPVGTNADQLAAALTLQP